MFALDIVCTRHYDLFSHQELLSHLRTKGPRQQQTENIFQLKKENRFFFSRDRCESFATNNKPESMESRMIDAPTGFHGKEPEIILHKFCSGLIQIGIS